MSFDTYFVGQHNVIWLEFIRDYTSRLFRHTHIPAALVILLSGMDIWDEMTDSESRANVSEHSRGICVHDICKDCSPITFHPPLSDHEELIAYFLGIIIASITVSSNFTLAKTFPPSHASDHVHPKLTVQCSWSSK